jgi:hypothetical protein
MKIPYMLGTMLAIVVGLCALGTSVAFAEAEWLVNGNQVTTEKSAETSGELELTDNKTLVGVATILCSLTYDGTIGPKSEGLITALLSLAGEEIKLGGTTLLCTGIKGCEKLADVELVEINIPWLVVLETMKPGEPTLDLIFTKVGLPGVLIICLTLGVKIEDECSGATSTSVENVTGGVNQTFTPAAPTESEKLNCTVGGAASGEIHGTLLTKLTEEGTLTTS